MTGMFAAEPGALAGQEIDRDWRVEVVEEWASKKEKEGAAPGGAKRALAA